MFCSMVELRANCERSWEPRRVTLAFREWASITPPSAASNNNIPRFFRTAFQTSSVGQNARPAFAPASLAHHPGAASRFAVKGRNGRSQVQDRADGDLSAEATPDRYARKQSSL